MPEGYAALTSASSAASWAVSSTTRCELISSAVSPGVAGAATTPPKTVGYWEARVFGTASRIWKSVGQVGVGLTGGRLGVRLQLAGSSVGTECVVDVVDADLAAGSDEQPASPVAAMATAAKMAIEPMRPLEATPPASQRLRSRSCRRQ